MPIAEDAAGMSAAPLFLLKLLQLCTDGVLIMSCASIMQVLMTGPAR